MNKIFIFPGQGSQTIGMAKDFYENFVEAKEVFEIVDEVLNKNLTKIMFEGPEELLTSTENSQPAIMTASIAILRVLEKLSNLSIDKLCKTTAGHSLGEYTALCAAEALTLEDTTKLLKVRGEAFAEAGQKNSGSMVALVGATPEQAEDVVKQAKIDGEVLQIANDNTIGQIVLSGSVNSVDKAIEVATEMKIKRAVKLNVSGAFHSKLMEPAIVKMEEVLKDVEIKNAKINVIANFTADFETTSNEIRNNLINQITGKVRWRETMLKAQESGIDTFVEIGNGKVLSAMVPRTCPDARVNTINSLESLDEFLKTL